MSAPEQAYLEMFGSISTDSVTMARCACVACNSCTCACSCRYAPGLGEIEW